MKRESEREIDKDKEREEERMKERKKEKGRERLHHVITRDAAIHMRHWTMNDVLS